MNPFFSSLIFRALLGEGEEDHGQLLLGDFSVLVEVAPLQNRLLKVGQIFGVVILSWKENKNNCLLQSSKE